LPSSVSRAAWSSASTAMVIPQVLNMVTRAVDGRQMTVRTRWLMIGKRLPSRTFV
jgi:hypothetical protein